MTSIETLADYSFFLNKMINRLAFSLSEGYILKDMMDKETIQQLFIRYYAKMLRVARLGQGTDPLTPNGRTVPL